MERINIERGGTQLITNLHSYKEQVLSYQIETRYVELKTSYLLIPGNSTENIIRFQVIHSESYQCEIDVAIYKEENNMSLKFNLLNSLVQLTLKKNWLGLKDCNISLIDVLQSITYIHIDRYEDYILYKNVGEEIDISDIRYTSCKKSLFKMILDIQYIINKSFHGLRT